MIYIDNIKKSEKTLKKLYPNAKYVDVTSKAKDGLIKLSPFYPHGDIPIPFSYGIFAKSVEGIWQGLKVFEYDGVDKSKFSNDTMKNIKRSVRKFGKPKGHKKGVDGNEFLDYIQARIYIYLPSYLWILENKVKQIIERLKIANQEQDIVLLDYATNCDVLDPRKPLSHAFLVKAYADGDYPTSEKLEKKLKEIENSGVNPYQWIRKEKKKKKELSDKNKLLVDEILVLIDKKPLNSKKIISILKLDIKTITLTKILKKSKKIRIIQNKPLKFLKKQID